MIAAWPWRRTFRAYVVSAATCGVALGVLVSVRLPQRFLGEMLITSTARGAVAIDGTTALSRGDRLFEHIVSCALLLLVAATLAFFAFALLAAFIDRAVTKAQFDPSSVTASRVLEPFYALDTHYQRATLAGGFARALVWLSW